MVSAIGFNALKTPVEKIETSLGQTGASTAQSENKMSYVQKPDTKPSEAGSSGFIGVLPPGNTFSAIA